LTRINVRRAVGFILAACGDDAGQRGRIVLRRCDFLVPLLTFPDPTPKEGLARALDMAASIGGRLSVVVQEIDIPPVHNPLAEKLLGVSGMAAQVEQRSRETGEALATELQVLANRLNLAVDIRHLRCTPEAALDRVVTMSRSHDATLLVHDPVGAGHIDMAEAVLFGSGGPVLLCPPLDGVGHLRSVAVAWDGSRAAARAVRDALPVLRLAGSATILTMGEDKAIDAAGVAGLLDLLAYHDIATRHVQGTQGDQPIGEALQAAALANDAGLLVMGAFGHNRFRQFVLGGATQSALREPRLPILMSH
jgi:nucleotide-binding universal stress UspA family protein